MTIGLISTNLAPASTGLKSQSAVTGPDSRGQTVADDSSQNPTVSVDNLDTAVSKLNDYVQNLQRSLSFSIDEATGRTVVKVIDTATDEVIRQLPPDETLKLAASIDQQLASGLFKEHA